MSDHQWTLDIEKLRAANPKHILFLCVANSARSQLAEAIARSLAPPDVQISSAGSRPSQIHPLAIEVLREIGIDATQQRAKHVDTIHAQTVDAVITLCAEEAVSYTHLRAHETVLDLVCRLLLEKKKNKT